MAQRTIVLIEDEETLANLLRAKLQRAGYDVKTAGDGMTGLDLIRSLKPDLVLLDLLLPRLSGFGILEKLTEEHFLPDLPIMIISNSGQPVEIDRALKMGVKDYAVKVNFDPAEVLEKVNRFFEENPALPVSSGAPRAPAAKSAGAILIIEDDLFLVDLLEQKFLQENYTAYRAIDVEQARESLTSQLPDVILLDIVLPGTDGFAFLKELKENPEWKRIPVIIISNLGQQEEMQRGLQLGAQDYIIKAHATPAEIVAKVRGIIQQSQ